MLFERGPLELVAEDQFPVAGPRPPFLALAAAEGRELEGAAGALGASLEQLAGAADPAGLAALALELGAAADELARQSRHHDTAIGDVAAGADALELVLAGLTGEIPEHFAAPPQPPPVEEANTGKEPPPTKEEQGGGPGQDAPPGESPRPRPREDAPGGGGGGGGGAPGGGAPGGGDGGGGGGGDDDVGKQAAV